jgi:hypothetical protein
MTTGAAFGIRPLYSDGVYYIQGPWGVVITSVTYAPYKSDLADRIAVLEPSIGADSWYSDKGMREWAQNIVPRLRYLAMQGAAQFFRAISGLNGRSAWRLGDFGYILTALGYDAEELMRQERQQRSRVIGQDDPLIDMVVEGFENRNNGADYVDLTIPEMLDRLARHGQRDWTGRRVGRTLAERRNILLDRGIRIEDRRTAKTRFWRFSDANLPAQEDLL